MEKENFIVAIYLKTEFEACNYDWEDNFQPPDVKVIFFRAHGYFTKEEALEKISKVYENERRVFIYKYIGEKEKRPKTPFDSSYFSSRDWRKVEFIIRLEEAK